MYLLNKTSNSSRFYEWVWKTDVRKFKTMCPYFWRYVFTIVFLPIILLVKFADKAITALARLLCKPLMISQPRVVVAFKKRVGRGVRNATNKVASKHRFWNIFGKVFISIFLGGPVLVLVLVLGYLFYENPVLMLAIIGGVTLLFVVIFLICYLWESTRFFRKLFYPFRLFARMAYSVYKSVCPIIIWE